MKNGKPAGKERGMGERMREKNKTGIIIVSALLFLTLAFIWGNSILSAETSGKESQGIYNSVKPAMDAVFGEDVVTHGVFRKLAHGAEFFVLGTEMCLLFLFLGLFEEKRLFTILSCGLFAAVIDESIQVLTSRGSAVTDVLIDFGGVAAATAIFYAAFKTVAVLRSRRKNN